MTSVTTERFRSCLAALPAQVQERARLSYRLFRQDPTHPSLRFKQVHTTRPIFSVRVGLGYRALAVRDDQVYVWFWIGTHAEYDRLLKGL